MTIDLYAALAASVGVLPAAWAADLTEPVEPIEGDVDLWVDRGDERRMDLDYQSVLVERFGIGAAR